MKKHKSTELREWPLPCFFQYCLLACFSVFLIGCASVNPAPFTKYRTAVHEAQTGIDAVMSTGYDWTRSGFVEGFASNPSSKFSELMIQPGAGYDWSLTTTNPPVYISVKQVRSGLAQLNGAFANYADLLVQLSGGELVDTAKFDQLAKDLNQNSTDALKALKQTVPSEGLALFSAAASEAARLYIEHKRQVYLLKTIEGNQANVTKYSDLCVSLVQTLRGAIKSYYGKRIEPIRLAWEANAGEKRLKNTEAMLNMNEQFADAMHVLQELETAYKTLPAAHSDLAKGVEHPKFDVAGIQKLYSSAKRLQQLYSELKKSEEKSTKP